jgi:hypothetical protein
MIDFEGIRMDEHILQKIIEQLQFELIQLAAEKKSLTDETVIAKSQLLDKYLLIAQREKMKQVCR